MHACKGAACSSGIVLRQFAETSAAGLGRLQKDSLIVVSQGFIHQSSSPHVICLAARFSMTPTRG